LELIRQYGKSSVSNIRLKQSFFNENDTHVNEQKRISIAYMQQPKRLLCKNCNNKLKTSNDFVKNEVGFKICGACSHLNGAHEDTQEFCDYVYTEEDGKNYAKAYEEVDIENYNYRLSTVYIPKAEFLYSSLLNDSVNPHQMSYLDFGCGVGYFVGALQKIGLKNIAATDVSEKQVQYGNRMIGCELSSVHKIDNTTELLRTCDANIVSMIGVLEHLSDPYEALKSIRDNKNVQYLYLSVPLFSLSVYLEMFSPTVYHRHLLGTGGHTHLYTQESLQYIINEFDFKISSEWWFGADMVDLYRGILVQMHQNKCSNIVLSDFEKMFTPIIDAMQIELDKKHSSSEVHMLLKKNI